MPRIDQSVFVPAGDLAPPSGHVLTPGGYRHPSMVHFVPRGHLLRRRQGRMQLVERSTRRIRERFAAVPPQMPVPGTGSGWVTYASWLNSTGSYIAELTTQWTVPPPPSVSGSQTVFLFNGLQDAAQNDLLQPVLQWGASQAGGGPYWAVSSWFIDLHGHASYSQLTPVNPGDILTGVMTVTGFNGSTYSYQSSFEGFPDSSLTVQGVDELTLAVQVLEAYQIVNAFSYPAAPSTALSAIGLTTAAGAPSLDWQVRNVINNCGEYCSVGSNQNPQGIIEIFYT